MSHPSAGLRWKLALPNMVRCHEETLKTKMSMASRRDVMCEASGTSQTLALGAVANAGRPARRGGLDL